MSDQGTSWLDSQWQELTTRREATMAQARARLCEDMADAEREFASGIAHQVVARIVKERDDREARLSS